MFRKIVKVFEKILLVVFSLSYLIHFILNIGATRNGTVSDISEIIIVFSIILYVIVSPLIKVSNISIFLLSTSIAAVLCSLLTPLIFLNFQMLNLTLFIPIYLVVFIKSIIVIKANSFLKWLTFVTSFIICFYILFLENMLISGITDYGYILVYKIGYGLFLFTTVAMIFAFPNSNYADWKVEHRRLFMKLTLSVWLFIFVISTLQLFIPMERYKDILFPEMKVKWEMKNYFLDKKPGMTD